MVGFLRRSCAKSVPVLILLLAFGSGVSPSRASRVRTTNVEEMTGRADRIFSGRCIDVRATRDPASNLEIALVTLEVDRVIKGQLGDRVTVKMLSNDVPRFEPGEEVVLFLHGDSAMGLTSPIGLSQGKFSVIHDKRGRELAINGLGNRGLLGGISDEAAARLGAELLGWKSRGALPLETLLEGLSRLADDVPAPAGRKGRSP